ncbi:hypothetical protein [Cellulomonas sp. P5_C5]
MTDYTSSYPRSDGDQPGTADAAKEQATHLKDKAADAGGHLLGEAKGEAAAVTQEARRQLGDLWTQARTEVSGQVGTQQSRLAGGLTTVGDQLAQMAAAPGEQNVATDIARELGTRVTSLGQWLESHGPDEALDEVRSFARRRPGTFLVLAAGAGVVLGRLTRGLKDAPSTPSSAPQPAPVPVPERTVTMPPPAFADPVDEPVYADSLATAESPVIRTPAWDPR